MENFGAVARRGIFRQEVHFREGGANVVLKGVVVDEELDVAVEQLPLVLEVLLGEFDEFVHEGEEGDKGGLRFGIDPENQGARLVLVLRQLVGDLVLGERDRLQAFELVSMD